MRINIKHFEHANELAAEMQAKINLMQQEILIIANFLMFRGNMKRSSRYFNFIDHLNILFAQVHNKEISPEEAMKAMSLQEQVYKDRSGEQDELGKEQPETKKAEDHFDVGDDNKHDE